MDDTNINYECKIPTTRKEAVDIIKNSGKYDEFVSGWGRTPEQYFEEYAYKEPNIWSWILSDIGLL